MLAEWQRHFPDCEPIAHRLRTAFRSRWVRFHSLPDSKRYPETEDEYGTVVYRHNCVLGNLVGSAPSVVLLTTGYSKSSRVTMPQRALRTWTPKAKLWRSILMNDMDGFIHPSYWHVSPLEIAIA